MQLSSLERAVWYLGPLLSFLLLIFLAQRKLLRQYTALAFSLAVSLSRTALLIVIPFNTNRYAEVWMITAPVLWVAYVLVGWEIAGKIFESYRGLSILSRRSLLALVSITTLVAIAVLGPELNFSRELYPWLLLFSIVEKTLVLALSLFLLALCGFMAWYAMPVRRNLVYYALGYTLFLLGLSASLYLRNVFGASVTRWISTGALTILDCCLVAWMFTLTRTGDELKAAIGLPWHPSQQQHLTAQLAAMNSYLMGGTRKI